MTQTDRTNDREPRMVAPTRALLNDGGSTMGIVAQSGRLVVRALVLLVCLCSVGAAGGQGTPSTSADGHDVSLTVRSSCEDGSTVPRISIHLLDDAGWGPTLPVVHGDRGLVTFTIPRAARALAVCPQGGEHFCTALNEADLINLREHRHMLVRVTPWAID